MFIRTEMVKTNFTQFIWGLNKKINAASHFGFKPSVNHCKLCTIFLSLTSLIHDCSWIFILKWFLKGWLIQLALAWIRSHDGECYFFFFKPKQAVPFHNN